MKRLLDILLIAILLGAAGIGAYAIGHHVDHLSNQASSQDAELNGTTTVTTATTAVHQTPTIDGRQITPMLVGGVLVAILLTLVLVTLINAAAKSRRRERWRVS